MPISLPVLQVSELTRLIKERLEGDFPELLVEGEISNFKAASSGHFYFALKDQGAILQAVMFKNRIRELDFEPQDGMLVRARGALSVYAQRGNYQIVCESLSPAGLGDILAMLEERKRKLAAEGLFDEDRKRPIPAWPKRIALITSPTGAAIRDILNILRRRNPGLDIIVLPSAVQGAEAAASLTKQLEIVNRYSLADLVIIGRGGGSLEDLLPFSDEALVRAVAASKIPVISAVGHEVDWSLCDYAADLRAPTPSAAAELASLSREDLSRRFREQADSIQNSMRARIERSRLLARGFTPENLELAFRQVYQPFLQRFDDAKEEILMGLRERALDFRHRYELALGSLEASSPEDILKRGYSVVRKGSKLIRDSRTLAKGELVNILFAVGSADARLEGVTHEES